MTHPRSDYGVYNEGVPDIPEGADWSPADHPYAVAVSEAMWWRCAVQLAVARLDDSNDLRSAPVSSQQVDARNLVFALVQLLAAEQLEQMALRDLGVKSEIREELAAARARFLAALPGIQEMRNALTHFDEWAVGYGRGPQRRSVVGGSDRRDVAGAFWGFGYDPGEQAVRLGPFKISAASALRAATKLERAIGAAAIEVDRRAQ